MEETKSLQTRFLIIIKAPMMQIKRKTTWRNQIQVNSQRMEDVIIAAKRDITFTNVFMEKEAISIKGNISENPKRTT